jgi:hypothetical protein
MKNRLPSRLLSALGSMFFLEIHDNNNNNSGKRAKINFWRVSKIKFKKHNNFGLFCERVTKSIYF